MPTYTYTCPVGHSNEVIAGYEDAKIECRTKGCKHNAMREAVYREQGVVFSGPDFTRSVLPPPAPLPPSSAGESTTVDFEKKDEFAEKSHKDDVNVRPYR